VLKDFFYVGYSTKLFKKAQTVIPGGVNSPVRAFRGVGGTPFFTKSGKGPFLIDVDNQQYVDYVCSWGSLILGHAHPEIIEALQKAVTHGLSFGTPTEIEVEVAALITRLMPSIQQIRMVNSGTEATQSAVRLARGFTGRNKILKFQGCYHGHSDSLLVKGGSGLLTFGVPDSLGIPAEFIQHTLVAPFNDVQAVQQIFTRWGEEIAAIIVEPIAGNMNCILPTLNFLSSLRTICDQYESLLIFDEVITGFRVALQGAQSLYQVVPDLTCLGKIIGGGLPVGAFGGRQEVMEQISPHGPVYQSGTLSGNPITLTAGLTTLQILQRPQIYQNLVKATQYFLKGLKTLADQYSIPLHTQSAGSMFGIFFTQENSINSYDQVGRCSIEHFKQFFHGLLERGVYLAPSAFEVGFLSTVHTEAILDRTLEAAKSVFSQMTVKEYA
jgi:glutamate-1-semialdehyde 2,1-aminomutase